MVAVPLAKDILAPIGVMAAAPAIDTRIQTKIHSSGMTTLIISKEEINDVMKAHKDSSILLKGITKTIENETKEQKDGFLRML